MQGELDPDQIAILGVNEHGEDQYENWTDGRSLPVLQDTPEQGVWTGWGVEYRDVIIVDRENRYIDVYNLSENDLADDASFDALRTLLSDYAAAY